MDLEGSRVEGTAPAWARPSLRRLVGLSLGAVAFYVLYTTFYSPRLWTVLTNFRPIPFALALATYSGAILCSSLRLRTLLPRGHDLSVARVHGANLYGFFMGEVTPGRSGYLLSVLPLRRQGVAEAQALSSILLVQVMDFVLRAAVAMAALVYFASFIHVLSGSQAAAVVVAALALTGSVLGAFVLVSRTRCVEKILGRLHFPLARRLEVGLVEFRAMASGSRSAWKSLVPLSIGAWLLTALRWYWVAQALGMALDPTTVLLLQPLLGTLAFLPISVGGLGILEGGVATFLVLLGFPAPLALGFALVDRGVAVASEFPGAALHLRP